MAVQRHDGFATPAAAWGWSTRAAVAGTQWKLAGCSIDEPQRSMSARYVHRQTGQGRDVRVVILDIPVEEQMQAIQVALDIE